MPHTEGKMQAYGEHKDCQLTDFCELGLLGRCPQTTILIDMVINRLSKTA